MVPRPRSAPSRASAWRSASIWLTKRVSAFVAECLECLGGAGYVEESPLPRLYREAPVNAIWEGSGNVIALDVLRTLARDAEARAALRAELASAAGADQRFDAILSELAPILAGEPVDEAAARRVVERLARLLCAAVLLRHAPGSVAHAYCAQADGAGGYGSGSDSGPTAILVGRIGAFVGG